MTSKHLPTPAWLSTLPHQEPAAFRAFRQFNTLDHFTTKLGFGEDIHKDPEGHQDGSSRSTSTQVISETTHERSICAVKSRLNQSNLAYFDSPRMPDKIARVLGEAQLLDIKEVVESFEFFQRVRHRINRPDIVDLCCGHGFVGMLFALLERRVERVYLLDRTFPASSYRIEEALNKVWPWVSPKLTRLECSVKGAAHRLPKDAGVVAVHACGARTDWALDVALELGGPLAVMPCCYTHQVYQGPETLKRHLGVTLCVDIQRTLNLNARGYQVDWQEIPHVITPKNRIIAASPPRSL